MLLLEFWRFCQKDYEPFDENDSDKYVVGADYDPPSKVIREVFRLRCIVQLTYKQVHYSRFKV